MDEDAATSSDRSLAAPPDVECAVCVGVKRRAQQACLECVASYCETHLDLHNTLHAWKRHKLVEPGCLQERICPEHDKPLQVFCRTDQLCVCYLCLADKHKGHEVVTIEEEVAETQTRLGAERRECVERITNREQDVQELTQVLEAFQASAEEAMERSEGAFAELMLSMEGRRRAVTELIREKEEAVVKEARELVERVRQEITDLKNTAADLERLQTLSHTNDDIGFLQGGLASTALPKTAASGVLLVQPHFSCQLASEAVAGLVKELRLVCETHFTTIAGKVKEAGILVSPAQKMREDFLQDACTLTLNPNTAHVFLGLSKDNREVTAVPLRVDRADHPERFDCRAQVLCRQSLHGRPFYWELEYRGKSWVCISVSYAAIYRKGKRGPLFGRNPYSWGLRCHLTSYEFWHNNKKMPVSYDRQCSRIGVYLDHGAGVLAFYNITDNMSLIHKVQTRFTKPVYAGFGLAGKGTHVKLCDLGSKDETTTEEDYFSDSSSGLSSGESCST
ncbi:tripartite motif-containing protein 16 [Electrophorus electricus]|uniref:tripartite motif-containing protein 16 n=1 Tax=Electrophorus electricus TaxID=8005 RepID=UPI0015D09269|nr:tripartite motif-containing protein 16 [Electrophorus electricus]